MFFIEIFMENEKFVILMQDVEKPLQYILKLPENEGFISFLSQKKIFLIKKTGLALLKIEKHNVDNLVEKIKFENQKLVIKGTKHVLELTG